MVRRSQSNSCANSAGNLLASREEMMAVNLTEVRSLHTAPGVRNLHLILYQLEALGSWIDEVVKV